MVHRNSTSPSALDWAARHRSISTPPCAQGARLVAVTTPKQNGRRADHKRRRRRDEPWSTFFSFSFSFVFFRGIAMGIRPTWDTQPHGAFAHGHPHGPPPA